MISRLTSKPHGGWVWRVSITSPQKPCSPAFATWVWNWSKVVSHAHLGGKPAHRVIFPRTSTQLNFRLSRISEHKFNPNNDLEPRAPARPLRPFGATHAPSMLRAD